ncbi:hypothetical protein ABE41_006570 [Fictibacillus arsenicus]|uniref:Doublecortin domain-containing protein n=1 Tax=Fictibacillus arsenicus TaxID=255247 RepID=A0A1B1Z2H6_9BACL|nr:hypothetical protein [Fictibacillus arsenicus]ANX11666.1 hypothetical protein ABE41_006570 [Fictibacillus arsenicus]
MRKNDAYSKEIKEINQLITEYYKKYDEVIFEFGLDKEERGESGSNKEQVKRNTEIVSSEGQKLKDKIETFLDQINEGAKEPFEVRKVYSSEYLEVVNKLNELMNGSVYGFNGNNASWYGGTADNFKKLKDHFSNLLKKLNE